MASTFTGLKLQGLMGHFGKMTATDIDGYVELPDGKVCVPLVFAVGFICVFRSDVTGAMRGKAHPYHSWCPPGIVWLKLGQPAAVGWLHYQGGDLSQGGTELPCWGGPAVCSRRWTVDDNGL